MYRRLLYLLLIFVMVSAACSFGGSETPTTAPTQALPTDPPKPAEPTATEMPEATSTPEGPVVPEGAVTSLDDVKSATIQIIAEGSFVDPEVGQVYNAAGSGSGFIIDPSGIAVTNNHVVTGSALLKVYVGGETKPRNAKVLGVSECSDLAVIDIDGDGYPFLQWGESNLKVGTDVYAAGFPLGDPEFTLTRGIVSKARADGETNWASVDNVIEHDATIKPGNSGGPLINKDGQVVGINYAGFQVGPFYAIAQAEADKVIEILRGKNNVNSLGINGQAVISDDGSLSGIWVSSVASGSPADKTGIKGGDIVTSLENIILATDGTMADYCDILRSHTEDDTLNVTILRFADQTVLEGQVNGRDLAVSYSFAQNLTNDVQDSTSGASTGQYTEYVAVTDDTGSISVEVPTEWAETDGAIWEQSWGNISFAAPSITASGNLDTYFNSWDESGVFFTASSDLGKIGGYVELLDGVRDWYKNDCKLDQTQDYSDALYEGRYQLWTSCGANDTAVLVLSARPIENVTAFLILVEVKITKDSDLDALDHILQTFVVVGDV